MASSEPLSPAPGDCDRIIGFTLPGRAARGRVVRLGGTLDAILSAHAYPDPIARLLGESLAFSALLGALLRPEEGQLTLQARGEGGPVQLLVSDYRATESGGELRGYVAQDLDRRFPASETLDVLFGRGQLVITLDQTKSSERYQGIVELTGSRLQFAAQSYFEDSEQLPTLVRLAAARSADGRWTAGGIIVQHLARAEEGARRLHVDSENEDWQHVAALAGSITEDELSDAGLPLESLLWRLFNEDEVRLVTEQSLQKGCRCSVERIANVLSQFSDEDRAEMRNADGKISVDCEFCSRQFLMDV